MDTVHTIPLTNPAAGSPARLSVVMPNFNHAAFLAEAITGIATQSRPPDEFIILDDGSTDDSLRVIEPFLKRYPFVRLIRHEKNRGVIESHRRLFAEASGEYVFAAAADDIRLPGFFESAMTMAEAHPDAGLVFGIMGMVDDRGRLLESARSSRWTVPTHADPSRFEREFLDLEPPWLSLCGATIYRRDALMEAGGYRAELGSWADTFAFRAIGLRHGVCYLAREVVRARMLTGSFSEQSRSNPRRMLDVIARAEHLMRSEEFRSLFPASHVRRWSSRWRRRVIFDAILDSESPRNPRAPFPVRNLRRLALSWRVLPLLFYRGDLSCFADSRQPGR